MSRKEAVSFAGLLAVIFVPIIAGLGAAHVLMAAAAWFEPVLMGWLR